FLRYAQRLLIPSSFIFASTRSISLAVSRKCICRFLFSITILPPILSCGSEAVASPLFLSTAPTRKFFSRFFRYPRFHISVRLHVLPCSAENPVLPDVRFSL